MAAPSDHSYDLFSRPANRKAETVLVVTPYVERDFFDQLISKLRPKRLHVIIDDGCRREDVQMIKDAVAASKRTVALTCTFGSAPGLVHLKLFYIVWRTEAKRIARTLIFGSANATRQGFSGALNAELIASCRLTRSRHSHIVDWCDEVVTATLAGEPRRIEPARDLDLGVGLQLRLPGITVGRERPSLSNFDLWIQRGYLLSDFRPEQSFLKLPVRLKQALGQTEQSRMVSLSGFEVPATKNLTYHYAGEAGADDMHNDAASAADGDAGNWRRRLFVSTHLGDWCSEACYKANSGTFRKRGYEDRLALVKTLEGLNDPAALGRARCAFIDAIAGLWDRLQADAGSFLVGSHVLDRDHYTQAFEDRVARDLELIGDPEFRLRYLTGYELAQVPRFRSDVRGWDEFLGSITRGICLDHARGRSQSWFLQSLEEALEADDQPSAVLADSSVLLKSLRAVWRDSRKRPGNLAKPAQMLADYHLR